MVDFRYHLVSLISVFMALAIGIVLGAGPLQNSIGNLLTNQVSSLRSELTKERELNAAMVQQAKGDDAFIRAVGDSVVKDRLKDLSVAVVKLPGADAQDSEEIQLILEKSGAKINAVAQINPSFFAPDGYAFRSAFVGQLSSYLTNPVSNPSTVGTQMGQAFAEGLMQLTDKSKTLLDMLEAAQGSIVQIEKRPTAAIRALVVVAPRHGNAKTNAPATENKTANDSKTKIPVVIESQRELVLGAASAGQVLVVGAGSGEEDLVSSLRTDAVANKKVSTIDSVNTNLAKINVVLGLQEILSKKQTMHYGVFGAVNSVVPQIALGNLDANLLKSVPGNSDTGAAPKQPAPSASVSTGK